MVSISIDTTMKVKHKNKALNIYKSWYCTMLLNSRDTYINVSIIGKQRGHHCVSKLTILPWSPKWGVRHWFASQWGMSFYTSLTIHLDLSNADEIWVRMIGHDLFGNVFAWWNLKLYKVLWIRLNTWEVDLASYMITQCRKGLTK